MNVIERIVEECRAEVSDPDFRAVRRWKEAAPGRACIGFFPVYVPQEVIHAAGALPVAVWGAGEKIEVEHADARLQSFICSISRSTLELGLTGRLEFLDGMLFGSLCDVARNLSGVWMRNFPGQFVDYLHYPQNLRSPLSRGHHLAELKRLAGEVGKLTGRAVRDEDLAASIALYEEQRALLRRLGAVRVAEPWRLSLEEWYVLVRGGGVRDPAEHNQALREVLAALPQRRCAPKDGVRVVLEGSFCEQPALELLRCFDQAHCFVVDADLGRGLRWFKEPWRRGGDPWQDVVNAYFDHAEGSVVRHASPSERTERLLARCKEADAQGVVFCIAKFCEPAFYDFVLHKRALERAGISFVTIEFEEKMGSFDSIRTQAETFSESILFFAGETAA